MQTILRVMPARIKEGLQKLSAQQISLLQEIRLRRQQPLLLKIGNSEWGLSAKGTCKVEESYVISQKELVDILHAMSGFSLYAIEDELKQGYLTLEGGHRVGLTGKAVLENDQIKTLKYMNGMNIRIAHEVIGCSERVMPYLVSNQKVYHTLIISPPGCGKTTLLRDIIRQLSDGYHGYGPYTVSVVDERSEIAACYEGMPQKNVGKRTDVLDGCPKAEGMRMLLRAMGPEVVAVDEIGKAEDCTALREMLGAGVAIICTVHGKDETECLRRPSLKEMLSEGLFERIIILSHRHGPGSIEAILDGTRQMKVLA